MCPVVSCIFVLTYIFIGVYLLCCVGFRYRGGRKRLLFHIFVFSHRLFYVACHEHGQHREGEHGCYVYPYVGEGVAVEDAGLVDSEIMAEREELRYSFQCGVHGEDGEGGAYEREAEHGPQGAHAHRHSERRHEAEHECPEALCRRYGEEAQQEYLPDAAFVGEAQYSVYVEGVYVEHGEEDEGLRKEFAQEHRPCVFAGGGKQLVRPAELQLRAEGVGGYEEHEEQHTAGDEHGAEVEVIVCPRVRHGVHVDGYGLQEGLYLPLGVSLCRHRFRPYSGGAQRGDGLHVLIQQGTGCERRVAIVERDLGLPRGEEPVGGALGEVHEAVDLVFLHCLACLVYAVVVGYDAGVLEGVELACHAAGG